MDEAEQHALFDEAEAPYVEKDPTPRAPSKRRAARSWRSEGAQEGQSEAERQRVVSVPEIPVDGPESAADGRPEGTLTLVPLLTARAYRVKPGDTIWYLGQPKTVLAVSATGALGFRPCGVAPPYFGLAGIDSMVRSMGTENVTGKVVEDRHQRAPVETDLGTVRVGWVSHALCMIPHEEGQDHGSTGTAADRRTWWSRTRRRQPTRLEF